MALQASTTYAPKHLKSLFYTTPLMSMFLLKKQTFLSKLGNQHNYQDNTITYYINKKVCFLQTLLMTVLIMLQLE